MTLDSLSAEEALLGGLPLPAFLTAADGSFRHVNPAWQRLFRLARPQADDWLQQLHPDDRHAVRQLWRDALMQFQPLTCSFRLLHGDGHMQSCLLRAAPHYDADGLFTGLLGNVEGLGESSAALHAEVQQLREDTRQSAEKLAVALDASPLATAIIGRDYRVRYLNPAFVRLFGYAPEELPDVQSWWEKAYPDPAYRQWIIDTRHRLEHEARHQGQPFPGVEVRIRCKDGGERPVLVSCNSLSEAWEGDQLVTFSDLSAQKAREDELQQRVGERTRELEAARAAAEQACEAQSRFIATLSHEIRTPLNSILGLSQLAQEHDASTVLHDYLQKIQCAGQHLLALVNDVLDFSKIEAGKLELDPVDFSPACLVQELQQLLGVRAAGKGLQLRLPDTSLLPAGLNGDVLRLRQILLNLLDNAIKFTTEGCVSLAMTAQTAGTEQIWLEVAVSDTGIGMSAAQQARLFTPYEQANGSITRHYGGTGLGLAICRELVSLLGGQLALQSQPGQGASFSFRLPLRPASGNAETRCCTQQALRGKRILLADDHLFNLQVAQELLEAVGMTVTVATSGADAVTRALAEPFDAILMDVQMPELDGLAATAAIRSHARLARLPIIAMTANVTARDRQDCLAAGMSAFLGKPVRADELYHLLAHCLGETTPPASPTPAGTAPAANITFPDLLDAGILHATFGPDRGRQARFLQKFCQAMHDGLAQLQQNLRAGDRHAFSQTCHRLKSLAHTVGAVTLAETLDKAEHAQPGMGYIPIEKQWLAIDTLFKRLQGQLLQCGLLRSTDATGQPEASAELSELQILLIDDDRGALALLQQQLQELGIARVISCTNAQAALNQLRQGLAPDWIFCDLQMPGVDGFDCLQQLGASGYAGQVAILSGLNTHLRAAAGELAHRSRLQLGAILAKPLRQDTLARLLRTPPASRH
ncbi:response regulator [Chitinilyticum litopenaei]|uniref:response regulator n=1 Tax=Chitinilyticum litopenaei TaxID=1121276 RepID=UPI0003FAD657|nr:response regulator [Chitinilyticum litopenaei]